MLDSSYLENVGAGADAGSRRFYAGPRLGSAGIQLADRALITFCEIDPILAFRQPLTFCPTRTF